MASVKRCRGHTSEAVDLEVMVRIVKRLYSWNFGDTDSHGLDLEFRI